MASIGVITGSSQINSSQDRNRPSERKRRFLVSDAIARKNSQEKEHVLLKKLGAHYSMHTVEQKRSVLIFRSVLFPRS